MSAVAAGRAAVGGAFARRSPGGRPVGGIEPPPARCRAQAPGTAPPYGGRRVGRGRPDGTPPPGMVRTGAIGSAGPDPRSAPRRPEIGCEHRAFAAAPTAEAGTPRAGHPPDRNGAPIPASPLGRSA